MGTLHSIILLTLFVALAAPACLADEKLDRTPIVAALIEVANDADVGVRYAAFDALQKQPRSEELLELFWRGVDDDISQIQSLCLSKVVEFEGPTEKVLKQLAVLLATEQRTVNDLEMVRQAERHLVAFGAPAIPYLIAAVKEDEPSCRAISALARIPLGEHLATVTTQLTALLKSESKDVRIAAVRSLQSIMDAEAKRNAEAKALAEAKTKDLDPRYLAYYTKLLQKYDSNSDGSLTKEEWSKMSKDPAAADFDQDGRITAVELGRWSMIRR